VCKPDGVRSVGRPKLRREDGADQDIRTLEVKNWKKVALDGTNGQSFFRRPGPTRCCRVDDDGNCVYRLLQYKIFACSSHRIHWWVLYDS